ncbi:hypothetical protein ACS0TY_001310 [Phlomoides rotata]
MKVSSLYVTFWWIILVFKSYSLVVVHLAMRSILHQTLFLMHGLQHHILSQL